MKVAIFEAAKLGGLVSKSPSPFFLSSHLECLEAVGSRLSLTKTERKFQSPVTFEGV